jgi:hypothetical protein
MWILKMGSCLAFLATLQFPAWATEQPCRPGTTEIAGIVSGFATTRKHKRSAVERTMVLKKPSCGSQPILVGIKHRTRPICRDGDRAIVRGIYYEPVPPLSVAIVDDATVRCIRDN